MSTGSGARFLLAVAVAAVLVAGLPPVALGQQPEGGPTVLLVVDASGSMARSGADGVVLMDAAAAAVETVVDALPEDARVGLRAYGHRVGNADALRDEGCVDTQLLVPVAEGVGGDVVDAADELAPSGWTALGTAMTAAVDDLDGAQEATVIVISDGEDNCQPPDPCQAAAALAATGQDLVVDTVGLLLDTDEARDQLTCMADEGDGEFITADDTQALLGAMRQSAARLVGRHDAAHPESHSPQSPRTGTSPPSVLAIRGASTQSEAPSLTPGEPRVQRLDQSAVLWFSLDDVEADDTVDVEVRRTPIDPDASDGEYVLVAGEVWGDTQQPFGWLLGGRVDGDVEATATLGGLVVPPGVAGTALRLEVTTIPAVGASPQDLVVSVAVDRAEDQPPTATAADTPAGPAATTPSPDPAEPVDVSAAPVAAPGGGDPGVPTTLLLLLVAAASLLLATGLVVVGRRRRRRA